MRNITFKSVNFILSHSVWYDLLWHFDDIFHVPASHTMTVFPPVHSYPSSHDTIQVHGFTSQSNDLAWAISGRAHSRSPDIIVWIKEGYSVYRRLNFIFVLLAEFAFIFLTASMVNHHLFLSFFFSNVSQRRWLSTKNIKPIYIWMDITLNKRLIMNAYAERSILGE